MLEVVEKRQRWSSDGDLPGSELIAKGIADLDRGRESIESLLVSIGAPRLAGLGIRVPSPFP